jgi:hypothetical protein
VLLKLQIIAVGIDDFFKIIFAIPDYSKNVFVKMRIAGRIKAASTTNLLS